MLQTETETVSLHFYIFIIVRFNKSAWGHLMCDLDLKLNMVMCSNLKLYHINTIILLRASFQNVSIYHPSPNYHITSSCGKKFNFLCKHDKELKE